MFGEDLVKILVAIIIVVVVVGAVFLIDAGNWKKDFSVVQTSAGGGTLTLSLENINGNDRVITSITIRVKPYGRLAFNYTFKPDRLCQANSTATFVLSYSEIYKGETAQVESFEVKKVRYERP